MRSTNRLGAHKCRTEYFLDVLRAGKQFHQRGNNDTSCVDGFACFLCVFNVVVLLEVGIRFIYLFYVNRPIVLASKEKRNIGGIIGSDLITK